MHKAEHLQGYKGHFESAAVDQAHICEMSSASHRTASHSLRSRQYIELPLDALNPNFTHPPCHNIMEQEPEVYATSFPSTWLDAGSYLPSSAEHVPSQGPPSQCSSLSDLESGISPHDPQRFNLEINESDNDCGSNVPIGSAVQSRKSVSSASKILKGSVEKDRTATNSKSTRLKVPNSRSPAPRTRAVSSPISE